MTGQQLTGGSLFARAVELLDELQALTGARSYDDLPAAVRALKDRAGLIHRPLDCPGGRQPASVVVAGPVGGGTGRQTLRAYGRGDCPVCGRRMSLDLHNRVRPHARTVTSPEGTTP